MAEAGLPPVLEPGLHVAGQVSPGDLDTLRRLGIASLINNRPDGEAPEQPGSTEIEAAAAALGIAYRQIPVVASGITEEHVASFARALDSLPRPILAFCRSGNRSTRLWLMARAGTQATGTLLDTARAAGHELEVLRPEIDRLAAQHR